jgi:uncharacterized protein
VLQFPQTSTTGDPLISLDTFTSNVGRDPVLSQAITQRATQVLRGDTLVVPIGTGLLYVQPLYLDTAGDPFPSLWQVVVGLGDNRVFSGPTFQDALQAALGGGSGGTGAPPPGASIQQLVAIAATQLAAWRAAVAAGDDTAAAQHFTAMSDAIRRAQDLAATGGGSGGGASTGTAPTGTAPATTAPAATTPATTTPVS